MEIRNKKVHFNYYIMKELEAGIVLTGTEIKSIREGSADLADSYIRIKNGEAVVINLYIAKYEEGNRFNHDERRPRKLLLHKKEITRLAEEANIEGYTIIPIKMYIKDSKAKLLVGVCKGKHLYDKRATIKKRDLERETRSNAR